MQWSLQNFLAQWEAAIPRDPCGDVEYQHKLKSRSCEKLSHCKLDVHFSHTQQNTVLLNYSSVLYLKGLEGFIWGLMPEVLPNRHSE